VQPLRAWTPLLPGLGCPGSMCHTLRRYVTGCGGVGSSSRGGRSSEGAGEEVEVADVGLEG
jgi:hypothetical protein